MDKDTYIVMRGCKILGHVYAYSNYHALRLAEKFYGYNLIVERISHHCST
jgi:hypothetical protein